MDSAQARARFADARHAVLGTVDSEGVPHLVPVTFVVVGDLVHSAIDHKPKRGTDLRRLRNIAANPAVCLLVEHYADDWTALWWARADGTARVTAFADHDESLLSRFQDKYRQYAARPPDGPVVTVAVDRWSGWAFTGS